MKTVFSFVVFSVFLLLAGCNFQEDTDVPEIIITEKTARLIAAENSFGFELYRNIFTSETECDNIMVSPLSVSLALAMTYNGADGETKTAMEKALKVYGLTPEEINLTYHELVKALKSLDSKVLLEIANAIFYREGFQVEDEFVSTNKKYYSAEISALDFWNEKKALSTINGWVAEKTHGKIESILNDISPDHLMFLLNAIYFKGIWQTEFKKENTRKLPFYSEEGKNIDVETMQRTDTLLYVSNELFSAIQLPYGKGSYNMNIFLPHKQKTLENIISELNPENWKIWIESFREKQNVDIKLPRFQYEYEITLNDILSEMGMGIAFTGAADFSKINKGGGLSIDFVKHKTFIEVNEEGTEAAAVTVVAIKESMTILTPFIVDRPFMYAITEKNTGAILFMGTVKNPQEN